MASELEERIKKIETEVVGEINDKLSEKIDECIARYDIVRLTTLVDEVINQEIKNLVLQKFQDNGVYDAVTEIVVSSFNDLSKEALKKELEKKINT